MESYHARCGVSWVAGTEPVYSGKVNSLIDDRCFRRDCCSRAFITSSTRLSPPLAGRGEPRRRDCHDDGGCPATQMKPRDFSQIRAWRQSDFPLVGPVTSEKHIGINSARHVWLVYRHCCCFGNAFSLPILLSQSLNFFSARSSPSLSRLLLTASSIPSPIVPFPFPSSSSTHP